MRPGHFRAWPGEARSPGGVGARTCECGCSRPPQGGLPRAPRPPLTKAGRCPPRVVRGSLGPARVVRGSLGSAPARGHLAVERRSVRARAGDPALLHGRVRVGHGAGRGRGHRDAPAGAEGGEEVKRRPGGGGRAQTAGFLSAPAARRSGGAAGGWG